MSQKVDEHGLVERAEVPEDPVLFNPDLEPTRRDERTWSKWNLAALWVGMSVCVPTYMLAGSLVASGMNWWQAMLAILLGNLLVLIPMILNGHAGTKYGIPFPVFARSSFGIFGAHVPSIARALVACAWFGIQTYIGGEALSTVAGILWEGWADLGGDMSFVGLSVTSWISFMVFWLLQAVFVWKGTESIKWLETLAAPFLLAIGGALLWWAIAQAGGLGVLLDQSATLVEADADHSGFGWLLLVFLPGLTAMVGYWATLSLNIPDFTRYCSSQKEQMLGQLFGLPTTMVFFSFIGVAVTSATVIVYDEAIWDPVELVGRLAGDSGSATLAILAMLALAVATLSTNIAANVVAPANSFSNAFPKWISFRTGGLIAAAIGIIICPWLILDELIGFLVTYAGLLGAVGGVLVADYWLLRKTRLNPEALYDSQGAYRYNNGFNWKGVGAMAAGIAVVLLGKAHPWLDFLFQGAWFSGFAASLVIYVVLMHDSIE
jgi:nucleobase:cation symporter-1, NCS1 family